MSSHILSLPRALGDFCRAAWRFCVETKAVFDADAQASKALSKEGYKVEQFVPGIPDVEGRVENIPVSYRTPDDCIISAADYEVLLIQRSYQILTAKSNPPRAGAQPA